MNIFKSAMRKLISEAKEYDNAITIVARTGESLAYEKVRSSCLCGIRAGAIKSDELDMLNIMYRTYQQFYGIDRHLGLLKQRWIDFLCG